MTIVVGMFTNIMTQYRSFIYICPIQSYKMPRLLQLISIHYWQIFLGKKMIRGRTMWDQTDGCANQYRCSIAYYLVSYLSTSYQIVLDRVIDTPGHGKDVVDGFNTHELTVNLVFFRSAMNFQTSG